MRSIDIQSSGILRVGGKELTSQFLRSFYDGASALAEAFDCGVNDLPLSFVLSWYEQKAVVILLTLFYLGIQDIRLGPSLPAFITPNVLEVLVKNFNIKPITTPAEDLEAILGDQKGGLSKAA